METKAEEFVRTETVKNERAVFTGSLITILIAYGVLSFLLNNIRATASLWLVWPLIAIQLVLYFFLFYNSYKRAQALGLSRTSAFILFVILAILGRVNDWEVVLLPLLVIIMVAVSSIKNTPERSKTQA